MGVNEQQNLLDKVNAIATEYKKNENQKIISIFHVTVLVILALASQTYVQTSPIIALFILLALICVAFAYLFLYIADAHQATTQAYTYIKGSTGRLPLESEHKLEESNKYGGYCRDFCLGCAVFSYIFIFATIYYAFDIGSLGCYIKGIPIFLILFVGYWALKFYIKAIKIEAQEK